MAKTALANDAIIHNFDRAAARYDEAASVQAQVAQHLMQKARRRLSQAPQNVLDIGSGTGLVADAAARCWPQARISAIDGSNGMLEQAQRKIPGLHAIRHDIARYPFKPTFDLILSSMALHWLPDPRAALAHWQKGLRPQGRLFAALLVNGSFNEWRNLCAAQNLADGLWPLPRADFAKDLAVETEPRTIMVEYPSARDFLRRLKTTGASTARSDHRPFGIAAMRRLLERAPRPFPVTYRVLYIEAPSPDSI